MPILFRLYTEDMPVLALIEASDIMGATIFHTDGIWQGTREASIVIEIIGAPVDGPRVLALAQSIALQNNQTEVLMTSQSSEGYDVVHVTALALAGV